MSNHPERIPETSELRELTQSLMILFKSAVELPAGPEKQAAIRTISQYQERVAALIRRSESATSLIR